VLAGAWLAYPLLGYFVVEAMEAKYRNVDGMTSARRQVDHEISPASTTAPL
jgi:hypothetical protein